VGFSRAKERMHFFLSKPVEEFAGGIGKALQHFKGVLGRREPESGFAHRRSRLPRDPTRAGRSLPGVWLGA
jgi:hypothetical protein